MLMRIFITGASGQLGSALQIQLSEFELFCADLPEFDITDNQQISGEIIRFQPDVVIHCAAYTNVEGAAKNPELAYKVNGLGTQNIALACLDAGADMVHISTNEVFAGNEPDGYEEWRGVNPVNPYARSKAAAEHHVRGILSRYYIVRTAWLYAREGNNFIHTILRSARDGHQLRVVTDEVGNPTYAYDLANALAKLIKTRLYGTYHFVNEGQCSRFTFAREALRLSGLGDVPVTPILSTEFARASSPPKFSALKNIAGAAIGIRLRPWQEALAEYLSES
jgi:dTDP-4-dehydrorhamnose reductase